MKHRSSPKNLPVQTGFHANRVLIVAHVLIYLAMYNNTSFYTSSWINSKTNCIESECYLNFTSTITVVVSEAADKKRKIITAKSYGVATWCTQQHIPFQGRILYWVGNKCHESESTHLQWLSCKKKHNTAHQSVVYWTSVNSKTGFLKVENKFKGLWIANIYLLIVYA